MGGSTATPEDNLGAGEPMSAARTHSNGIGNSAKSRAPGMFRCVRIEIDLQLNRNRLRDYSFTARNHRYHLRKLYSVASTARMAATCHARSAGERSYSGRPATYAIANPPASPPTCA